VSPALSEAKGSTVGKGVDIKVAEAMFASPVWKKWASQWGAGARGDVPLARPCSHKGAEARDGFADDQILHLIRAFV